MNAWIDFAGVSYGNAYSRAPTKQATFSSPCPAIQVWWHGNIRKCLKVKFFLTKLDFYHVNQFKEKCNWHECLFSLFLLVLSGFQIMKVKSKDDFICAGCPDTTWAKRSNRPGSHAESCKQHESVAPLSWLRPSMIQYVLCLCSCFTATFHAW